MPTRASTRPSRTSTAVSHKSSTASFNPRGSTTSRASIDIPQEAPDSALRTQVIAVFREAQRTTASHRKLVVTLRKIQEACCYEPATATAAAKKKQQQQQQHSASLAEFDEDDFNAEFTRCVLRVMPVKKSEGVGDKTVRFVGLFLRHSIDKDNEALGEAADADASTMPETPGTRLTARLLGDAALPLLAAKDKVVRYRATQLVSHVVNSLDAIDDDLFRRLRAGLLRRIRDKEAMVRAQAVLGLGRLAGQADAELGRGDSDDGGDDDYTDDAAAAAGLLERLLEVLQNDPSADVRRSLLVNLPILPSTLPYLLERARDQDAQTRRAVYARLLPALGDFRHLSLSMREKLLRWGLRDRDETVRKAAGRLFRERWIEDCASTAAAAATNEEDGEGLLAVQSPANTHAPSFDALLELLERIDVVNSGVENGVALEAMKGFWEGRPDYREAMVFDDDFWETLSAESVFVARSFNDFCRSEGDGKFESLADEKLPEVTKVAFYLERYIKALVDAIQRINEREEKRAAGRPSKVKKEEDEDEDEDEEEDEDRAEDGEDDDEDAEEDTVEREFIVEQLLHMALTLDYSDEVGRRKMFALLRQTLSEPELPDEITRLTVDVLRDLCAPDTAGEKEFCSIVLEAVADVHDTIVDEHDDDDDGESFHSARSEVSGDSTPTRGGAGGGGSGRHSKSRTTVLSEEAAAAKAVREIVINMKCLHMVQCMLANVGGSLQQNDHLVAMLNNLVVPAVRSHEAPVRERGLVCLGLCSLLDRSLAEENLTLFIHFFSRGHAALQVTALHILTDILNVHGAQLLQAHPPLLRVYARALRSGSGARPPEVQAAAAVAASKLLLGRVISPDVDGTGGPAAELLRTLVVTYFEPASAANQAVRQALNYALPVFCYARAENQALMRTVALDALHALYNVREGLDDDDGDALAGAGEGGEGDMVSLATVGACLVDWTDPRKRYVPGLGVADAAAERRHVNADVHLDFAQAIVERLGGNCSKEEKKIIAPLLGKLYVSPASSEAKTRAAYADVSAAVDAGLLADYAAGRNALYKIHVALGKIVNNLDAAAVVEGGNAADRFRRSVTAGTTRRSVSVGLEKAVAEEDEEERTVVPGREVSVKAETSIKEEEEEDEDEDDEVEGEGEEAQEDVTAVQLQPQVEGEGDSLVDELLSDGEA